MTNTKQNTDKLVTFKMRLQKCQRKKPKQLIVSGF